MSEYQYYEFQSLDQPLTPAAREVAKSLSSRAKVSTRSASFVYNYGDFPGNPLELMAGYFDAMLYITNWGTRQLMFRFPPGSIPEQVMADYQYGDGFGDQIQWVVEDSGIILNLELSETEATGEWVEGDGWLDKLTPVRSDILRGDYRAIYLAWLKITEFSEDEITEPPIPPNLGSLSAALEDLIAFFEVDSSMVKSAARHSASVAHRDEDLAAYLVQLTEAEKLNFLERLLRNEANLNIALANRLRNFSGGSAESLPTKSNRTVQTIAADAKRIREANQETERQAAQAAHIQQMEALAPREAELWARLPGLVEQKRADTYDEAVRLLKNLHDLAVYQGNVSGFQAKLETLRAAYPRLSGFQRRLQEARLI
jgi:hypothetical protein